MATKTSTTWNSNTDINRLPLPDKGNQVLYRDRADRKHSVPGLAVRVTVGGARAYVADRNTPRGRIRITLGVAGADAMTVAQAREQARIALGLVAQGFTPDQIRAQLDRQEERIPSDAVTLGQVMDRYLSERRHQLADSTRYEYRKVIDRQLADWKERPLEVINEDAVVTKFTGIASRSRANLAFKIVRALFRYARTMRNDDGTPVVTSNPVDVLGARRLWHKVKVRRDVVGLHQLPAWWRAVKALADVEVGRNDEGKFTQGHMPPKSNPETVSDFLVFMLLTGLRRSEGLGLKWENVDLHGRMFTAKDTKNGTDHVLPMADHLFAMLKRRSESRSKDPRCAPYVFHGQSGAMTDPEKMMERVERVSSVPFTLHTLRRSFATIAESLDIPFLALKRLLNHSNAGGVTGGYTVIDIERLREPMAKVENFILTAVGEKKSATVTAIRKSS